MRYANQPIALVIAETLEAATEGAALLNPQYEAEPARTGLRRRRALTTAPARRRRRAAAHRPWRHRGRASPPPRTSPRPITRRRPQYHNAMEPHAVVAQWDGDHLTLDMPNQAMAMSCAAYAAYFGIPAGERADPLALPRRRLRLEGDPQRPADPRHPRRAHAEAARQARADPRADVRPRRPSRRDLADAAPGHGRSGHLTALHHHSHLRHLELRRIPRAGGQRLAAALCQPRDSGRASRACGSTPARRARCARRARPRDRRRSRSAIDEAAEACGMDPLEFRLANYAETEPGTGRPFSSKALRECYAEGAKRFGWSGRPLAAAPDARRERLSRRLGHGHGGLPLPAFPGRRRAPRCAPMARRWSRPPAPTWARAPGRRSPRSPPRRSASIPIRSNSIRASRSLPDGGVAGGSGHTASAGLALHNAGEDAIAKLAELAIADPRLAAVRRRQCRRRSPAAAGCIAATMKAAAKAMPTSSRRAGRAEVVGTARTARDQAAGARRTPCTRTARSSPR